ncbi:unnamed protein product [Oikopleura dioica]|uniref:Uncharacterized protein n=1 Tax=Oikopleura dioica TaxID=34765 RepID=E4Y0T8_OIKDI|nr:unnamed protein product [Oikopleura dioica]
MGSDPCRCSPILQLEQKPTTESVVREKMLIRTGTPDNPADMAGYLPDVPLHKVELIQQISKWIETYQIANGIENNKLQAFSMKEMIEMLGTFTTEEEDEQNIYYHEWLGLDKDIENKYICKFTGWDPEDLVNAQEKANLKARGTVQKIVLTVIFIILLVIIVLALVNINKNTCSGDDCTQKMMKKIFSALKEPILEQLNKPDQPGNYRKR